MAYSLSRIGTEDGKTVEIAFDHRAVMYPFIVSWGRVSRWPEDDALDIDGTEAFFSLDEAIAARDRKLAQLDDEARIAKYVEAGRQDHRRDVLVMQMNSLAPELPNDACRMRLNASAGLSPAEYTVTFHPLFGKAA